MITNISKFSHLVQQYSLMEGGDFMKKALAIIESVLIVLSVVGLSFADDKEHATKEIHVSGEVTAVDTAANTLTIKGKDGEVVLATTDRTRFPEGKTLADIKVGDKLSTTYSEKDGKMMAWEVMTEKDMKKMEKHKEQKEREGMKMEIMDKMEKKQKEKE
jgi:hypothetical protein